MNNPNNQNIQNTQSNQNSKTPPITFLPQHGHYRHLRVYQVTEIIYGIKERMYQSRTSYRNASDK